MKKSCLIFLVFVCFSCDKNTNDDEITFGGFYKVNSIVADKSIDINNDGVASINLMEEIEGYFNTTVQDLEIRPNDYTDSRELLLSFYYPNQISVKGFPVAPEGYFLFEKNILVTPFKLNGRELVLDFKNAEEKELRLQSVTFTNGIMQANFVKKYYDYITKNWEELTIAVSYTKMDL